MTKAEVATHLCLSDTQSLALWLRRDKVPLKYHKALKELLDRNKKKVPRAFIEDWKMLVSFEESSFFGGMSYLHKEPREKDQGSAASKKSY